METMISALLVLAVVAALVAIQSRHMLSAIISLGAVGFLTAIVFLLLGAPDLAMVQIAVEVIALVILLRAVSGRADDSAGSAPSVVVASAAVALLAVAGAFALGAMEEFPAFGAPVMERVAEAPSSVYLREGLERTGAANIVSAVLLDFRAYDTLGEATVLFCAVLGALTVLRRRARLDRPREKPEEEGERR
jgi:multisubunit Na+/H+ antiporter MnhB subunit